MIDVQELAWKDDAEQQLEGKTIIGKVLLHRSIEVAEGRSDWWATGLLLRGPGGDQVVTYYATAEDKLMVLPLADLAIVAEISGRPIHT